MNDICRGVIIIGAAPRCSYHFYFLFKSIHGIAHHQSHFSLAHHHLAALEYH